MRDIMEAMSMLMVFICFVLIYFVVFRRFSRITPVRLIAIKMTFENCFNMAVCKLVYINHLIHPFMHEYTPFHAFEVTRSQMMFTFIIFSFYRHNPELEIGK